MRFVHKRSWLPLACLLSAQALFQLPANAGVESITPSDSGGTGVGDNFAPQPEQRTASLKCGPDENVSQLEQQIANEAGGQDIQVSRVGIDNIRSAVQTTNAYINQLDAQQLRALSDSPTFISLLDQLRDANTALNSNPDLNFEEPGAGCSLFSFSPAPVRVVEPEPPVVIPPEPIEQTTPEPPDVPAFREPIRGLW